MFDERCYSDLSAYKEEVIKGIGFNITDEAHQDSKVQFFGKRYMSGATEPSQRLVSDAYGADYTKTEQVMNTKRLKITFKLRDASDQLCEIKYYDSIVMNYLTQMIPSTCILEVEYTTKNF